MELKINRRNMQIIPHTSIDEAYIEEVLGLLKEGDCAKAVRHNAHKLNCIAYIEVSSDYEISK